MQLFKRTLSHEAQCTKGTGCSFHKPSPWKAPDSPWGPKVGCSWSFWKHPIHQLSRAPWVLSALGGHRGRSPALSFVGDIRNLVSLWQQWLSSHLSLALAWGRDPHSPAPSPNTTLTYRPFSQCFTPNGCPRSAFLLERITDCVV